MKSMTVRERCLAVLNFQPFDRLPIIEWAGWWQATMDRWHQDGGLPATMTDCNEIRRHFGLEIYQQDWFGTGSNEREIIGSMDDYEREQRLDHLFPAPNVNHAQWRQWAEQQKRGEIAIWFTLDGFFWCPRKFLGIEPHLYAFYDQPELMHRINSDLAEWQLKIIDEVASICRPDFMTFAEDLSYNHGAMLSRELFDEFLAPYYRKVIPRLKEYGIISFIDSDGDVTEPAAWFEDAGLEGIMPLERQAGVDIARLRREHPRLRFIGHFDKLTMNKGEAAMRAEFERLLPTAAKGGFIIGCDHQTPPAVSYEDYKLYIRLFREYAERAGRLSQSN